MSIPKIIHQIWIGPNPIPFIWINTIKSDYILTYPDFTYYLWTDTNINELFIEFPLIKCIYDAEETWCGKADILRYLILYIYGGIYIDADSVWLNNKNFNDLIENSSGFFAACEPDTNIICNGVIGTYKNNDILLKILKHIESYVMHDNKIDIKNYKRKRNSKGPSKLLGPTLFNSFCININITIFPSHYFYPICWHGITDINYHLTHKDKLPTDSFLFQYGYSTNHLCTTITD